MNARTTTGATLATLLTFISPAARAALQDCDVSATTVAFGAYDPLRASPTTSVGTISVTCQVTLVALLWPWDIKISTGGSGSYATRRMINGAHQLDYNLYLDSGYGTIWGDGTGTTSYLSALTLLAIGSSTHNFSIYGRVPAGQDRGAGSYSDTIIVTLNY